MPRRDAKTDRAILGLRPAIWKRAVMAQDGPRIAEISAEAFREFAKRYASSPEIGPIQTSLDRGIEEPDDCDHDMPDISKVFATLPTEGEAYMATDTVMAPGSLGAAMRAAGAV